jgi:hypothetical protein
MSPPSSSQRGLGPVCSLVCALQRYKSSAFPSYARGGARVTAAQWEHSPASDEEMLAAAVREWGAVLASDVKYARQIVSFEDADGSPGRLLVACLRLPSQRL